MFEVSERLRRGTPVSLHGSYMRGRQHSGGSSGATATGVGGSGAWGKGGRGGPLYPPGHAQLSDEQQWEHQSSLSLIQGQVRDLLSVELLVRVMHTCGLVGYKEDGFLEMVGGGGAQGGCCTCMEMVDWGGAGGVLVAGSAACVVPAVPPPLL